MEIEPAHHSKEGFAWGGLTLLTNSMAHVVGPWNAAAITLYGGAGVAIYAAYKSYKFLT